jgi:predicted XRE-type DNA-binding protein
VIISIRATGENKMNTKENKIILIKYLKEIKINNELTQQQLGKMIEMPQPRLSLLLNAKRLDDFKIDLILFRLEKIGVTIDLNFNGEKRKSPIKIDNNFLSQKVNEVKLGNFTEV